MMKKMFRKFEESGLMMVLLVALLAVFGMADAGVMAADVVNPAGGGAVRTDSETSRTNVETDSPRLILDEIDKKGDQD